AHAVEQEAVGIGRLDLQILGDHRRGERRLLLARGVRRGCPQRGAARGPHSRFGHGQGVASRPSPHKGMATNSWGKDCSASTASACLSMILSENRFTLFRIML